MNKKRYLIIIALVIFVFLAVFTFANPFNDGESGKPLEEIEEDVIEKEEEKEEVEEKEEEEEPVVVIPQYNNHGVTINKPTKEDLSYGLALKAVEKVENTLSEKDLTDATKLVEKVTDKAKKEELEERLSSASEIIDLTNIVNTIVDNVKAAKIKADMDSARNYAKENDVENRIEDLDNELIKKLLNEKLEGISKKLEDTKNPIINIEDGAILDSDTKITVTDDSDVTIKLNGEEIENNKVVKDGKYTLVATDEAFNKKEITFIVDTTTPEFIIKDTSVSSGEYFSKLDMQVTDDNLVSVTINGTKFGAITPYDIDSANYVVGKNTLVAADIAGNTVTYVFTLVKTVNVLEQNITLPTTEKIEIAEGETYVLDLNNNIYTVDNQNAVRNIINKGTLIIKNGKMVNSATGNNYGLIDNYGTLIVDNVEFTDNGAGDGSTIKNRGGEVTITNSKFKNTGVAKGNAGIYSDGKLTVENTEFESSSTGAYPLIVNSGEGNIKSVKVNGTHGALAINSGTVVIENLEYDAAIHYGIFITNDGGLTGTDETNVIINGGTFNGNSYGLWASVNDGGQDKADVSITINDGIFEGNNGAIQLAGDRPTTHNWDVTINGGTFNGNIVKGSSYSTVNWNLTINGGKFTSSVASDLTSEYEETLNNGYYEVTKKGA